MKEVVPMFSEYVVRAVVADHVERLRGEAVLDELVRCARSASSLRRVLTRTVSARAVSGRAVSGRAGHGRLLQHLAHPLTRSDGQPQPCGC
jgi:hypothetical protein